MRSSTVPPLPELLARYPDFLREQLRIGDEYRILCGIAIGYPDPTFPANHLDVPRDPVDANATFVKD